MSPVTGSITVTFDPAAGNVHEVTSGILLNSLNINFADVMAFNYYAASDTLEFGGLTFVHEAFAGLNFSTGVDDFIMDLAGASATPINNLQLSSLGYSQTGTGYFAGGNPASDSISITVASLPEAASYATFGAGLVGAMAMRRRKSKV